MMRWVKLRPTTGRQKAMRAEKLCALTMRPISRQRGRVLGKCLGKARPMNKRAEAWTVLIAVSAGSGMLFALAIAYAAEGNWFLGLWGFLGVGVIHAFLRRSGFFVVMDRRLFDKS